MARLALAAVAASGLALTLGAAAADSAYSSHFIPHSIATGLRGGYMVAVADLNRDGKPDLIPVVSQLRDLTWYENPTWARHVVASGFTGMINVAP